MQNIDNNLANLWELITVDQATPIQMLHPTVAMFLLYPRCPLVHQHASKVLKAKQVGDLEGSFLDEQNKKIAFSIWDFDHHLWGYNIIII